MTYDLNQLIDRKGTNSIKWEFMHKMYPDADADAIPMWVADMDFPCAAPILEALRRRVDRQIFGYSTHQTEEYFRAVCGWYQNRFHWRVDPEEIVYSPGVVPAIGYLIEILTEPGDGVMIQRPVYYPFTNMIHSHRRTVVNNPLINRNGHYEMDFADLERKVGEPGVKVMILCSPHNPVGRVWKEAELVRMGEICLDNGITIISDEIHYDILRKGIRHIPLATLFPRRGIITATAPSKTFNLAGMQLSNIVIHDAAIRERWNAYVCGQLGLSAPNPLSIVAAQAAYEHGGEWLAEILDYLDENIRFMQEFVQRRLPRAGFTPPEGTYLVWLDLSAYGAQEELNRLLIKEAKVLAEDGTIFGEEGRGFFRMNVACPRDLLRTALERIAAVLR
jgi:cystathionine beta-lyase